MKAGASRSSESEPHLEMPQYFKGTVTLHVIDPQCDSLRHTFRLRLCQWQLSSEARTLSGELVARLFLLYGLFPFRFTVHQDDGQSQHR